MKHTLNNEDLTGFESRVILASSTKDKKKLEIVSNINKDNNIITEIQVSVNDECRLITNNLQHAILHYNTY